MIFSFGVPFFNVTIAAASSWVISHEFSKPIAGPSFCGTAPKLEYNAVLGASADGATLTCNLLFAWVLCEKARTALWFVAPIIIELATSDIANQV
mmetsp:Transcript_3324/g.5023  ORF Transcript_3324/g.5023 Transcript_3324/m.5023 type:complete len:95 (-) Transcript_3324:47-331(-)